MATIYAVNLSEQTLADGDQINFGSIVRRCGCGYDLAAGSVVTRRLIGLHDISVNVIFEATSAGVATLQLYKDGVAIPGARAALTILSGVVASLSVADAITRVSCGCEESVITAVLSGISADVTSAAITVRS